MSPAIKDDAVAMRTVTTTRDDDLGPEEQARRRMRSEAQTQVRQVREESEH